MQKCDNDVIDNIEDLIKLLLLKLFIIYKKSYLSNYHKF